MCSLREVTIELTQRCNSRCVYCSSSAIGPNDTKPDNKHVMPLSHATNILFELQAHGVKEVRFSGGEPLLHPNFVEIIDKCAGLGMHPVIYTSGNTPLTSKFREIAMHSPTVVFNYPTRNMFIFWEMIGVSDFRPDDLDKVIVSIRRMGIRIEAHVILTRMNVNVLDDTVRHLRMLGIKRVGLLKLVPQGRAADNFDDINIDPIFLRSIVSKLRSRYQTDDFIISGGAPIESRPIDCACIAGEGKIVFRHDGVVFPCGAFKGAPVNGLYRMGDIHDMSVADAINSGEVIMRIINLRKESHEHGESCPAQYVYSLID